MEDWYLQEPIENVTGKHHSIGRPRGAAGYDAPEVLPEGKFNTQTDIWGHGLFSL